jgi:hypothetical protein
VAKDVRRRRTGERFCFILHGETIRR